MKLGPANGTLKVRTGVAGSASRMGHRLVLAVADWAAEVEMDGETPTAVQFRAQLDSLSVESGSGGVTPLTVVDRQVIRRNAVKILDSTSNPEVVFTSAELAVGAKGIDVQGSLTMHGVTNPLDAHLDVVERRVTASIPVVQTDFDIKPYSAMLSQLKVEDEVIVDLDILVPA